MNPNILSYVLVTPARNEERYIENTIRSVVSQTILPKRWAIVNDGSTDGTEAILRRYAEQYDWIRFIHMGESGVRDFAAKARCFNVGYNSIKGVQHDIVGNIDADVSFEKDYFEFLLNKFAEAPKLGVGGTPMREADHDVVKNGFFNQSDVFGACQLFRRECFEQIGGYMPVKWGGIDWVALRTAQMYGWKTRSFLEKSFFHHRPMGATDSNVWMAKFNYGRKDYLLGNHPLWQLCRIVFQMSRKPYLVGGFLLLFGYCWALFSRMERPITKELMSFHRAEEMKRLGSVFRSMLRFKGLGRTTR